MPATISTIALRDGNGALVSGGLRVIDVSGTGAGPFFPLHIITDGQGVAGAASVSANHTGDEQSNASGNSLLVNAIGGIQGPVGKTDVQRGIAFDASPGVGIPAGAQNYAVAYSTTLGAAITANAAAQSVLVGSSANMKVGSFVRVGAGTANQEDVYVSAIVDATHFTAIFTKSHLISEACNWFGFNVARDAASGDQIALTGLSASMTYLWNQVTNLGELDRSADGERDGASGKGTAVAAEFEWNGGGPLLNTGLASLLQFDRARNLQGKGVGTATQNAGGAAGATSITVSSATAVNSLQPGQQIRIDRGTGSEEAAYVATNYVPGTAAISLQSGLQFTHTAAAVEWDIFSSIGPGLNGFTAAGIGIEEEAIFNPVDSKYYIERSATQDAMPAANIVAESPALYNGATMDRARGNVDTAALVTLSAAGAGGNSADQTNFNGRGLQLGINITALTGTGPTLTVTVQGKDAASGVYYTLLASTALNATGFTLLTVYPGAPATANVSAPQVLPRTFRILYAIAGTTPAVTATIGASVIV